MVDNQPTDCLAIKLQTWQGEIEQARSKEPKLRLPVTTQNYKNDLWKKPARAWKQFMYPNKKICEVHLSQKPHLFVEVYGLQQNIYSKNVRGRIYCVLRILIRFLSA